MCGSLVDIKSPTAEIRRGKKEERTKKTAQKYNARICYAGRPETVCAPLETMQQYSGINTR